MHPRAVRTARLDRTVPDGAPPWPPARSPHVRKSGGKSAPEGLGFRRETQRLRLGTPAVGLAAHIRACSPPPCLSPQVQSPSSADFRPGFPPLKTSGRQRASPWSTSHRENTRSRPMRGPALPGDAGGRGDAEQGRETERLK